MALKWTPLVTGCLLTLVLSGLSVAQRGGGGIGGDSGPAGIGGRGAAQPAAPANQPPPLTDLDTVLLTVNVTGPENNAVTGIPKEQFQVLEDGVEQNISYFWEDSRPITVGFIFDDSERMGVNDKVNVLKEAAHSFLKKKDPRDEFFVVRMSGLADVVLNFTTDVKDLPLIYPTTGETVLYDAVYVGLAVIKEAANPRRLLVVVTSGGDTNAKHNDDMLKAFALKQNVQIFPIMVDDAISDEESEAIHTNAVLLGDLAFTTGGRMYSVPNSARTVEALMAEVARGLKTQYMVGFKSTRPEHDGKRRGVKVKVNSPEGSRKLSVWTKAAYFAPKD